MMNAIADSAMRAVVLVIQGLTADGNSGFDAARRTQAMILSQR